MKQNFQKRERETETEREMNECGKRGNKQLAEISVRRMKEGKERVGISGEGRSRIRIR